MAFAQRLRRIFAVRVQGRALVGISRHVPVARFAPRSGALHTHRLAFRALCLGGCASTLSTAILCLQVRWHSPRVNALRRVARHFARAAFAPLVLLALMVAALRACTTAAHADGCAIFKTSRGANRAFGVCAHCGLHGAPSRWFATRQLRPCLFVPLSRAADMPCRHTCAAQTAASQHGAASLRASDRFAPVARRTVPFILRDDTASRTP